jgi:hypothetical protein
MPTTIALTNTLTLTWTHVVSISIACSPVNPSIMIPHFLLAALVHLHLFFFAIFLLSLPRDVPTKIPTIPFYYALLSFVTDND